MSNLLVEEKQIVFPGDELADGMDYLPSMNVVRDGDKLIATKVGMVGMSGRFVKIIPLTGTYTPKEGDLVIGRVSGVTFSGWRVDIGQPSDAVIPLKDGTTDFIQRNADLTKYYTYGDYVVAQITQVYNGKMFDLSMKGPGLRKLSKGRIIDISPTKVPRVIGKKGSMISLIKENTGVKISVGQNGKVWLVAEDPKMELKALEAINLIQKESHTSGLTERVKEFLEAGK